MAQFIVPVSHSITQFMTPSPSVAQEMPSENSIEIDLNQTSGLLDEEITNAKDTMADENEEQHIDENIPYTK